MGRIIEEKIVTAEDLTSFDIGENYVRGVYFVLIIHPNYSKVIKLVKL